MPIYVYRAALTRVVDGDTLILAISLGCHVSVARPVRLLGVDTPEVVGLTKARGLAATQATVAWCAAAALANPGTAWPLVVATTLDKDDKFGRLLGVLYGRDDPVSLNDALVAAGHAIPYLI